MRFPATKISWSPPDLPPNVAFLPSAFLKPAPKDLAGSGARRAVAPSFKLLSRPELESELQTGWTVHGLLPERGLAVCYGPSGGGKSFLVVDLACAVAEGAYWFGRRTTKAPVIYVCLEGSGGLAGRVKAWEEAHQRSAPELLRYTSQNLNLHDAGAVDALIHAVLGLMRKLPKGIAPPVIVIDTLARATAGTDENNSVAMGATIEACGRLSDATRGLVMPVHHTGKDMERGMRGHGSLAAAADAALLVTKSGTRRRWVATKVKDAEDGVAGEFDLDTVLLGADAYGEPVTSCSVRQVLVPPRVTVPALPSALVVALTTMRAVAPTNTGSGDPIAVSEARWREEFYAQCDAASDGGKRTAFNRARKSLLEGGWVVKRADSLEFTEEGLKFLADPAR